MEFREPPQVDKLPISTVALRRDQYKIDPTYQRAPGVWEKWREQYLIDTILRGFAIPLIYIHKRENGRFIVDGQQRLLTIWKFSDDELKLSDRFSSDIIHENHGARVYRALSDHYKSRFDSYPLSIAYLEDYADDDIRSTFRRLQSGKPLSPGEKLNAYPGAIVPTMRRLGTHLFLTQTVSLGLGRYKDYYLAGMFLMLEKEGMRSTSPTYIREFFESNRGLDTESATYKKVRKALSYLATAFEGRAGELRTQAWIVSAYLLASYLIDRYAMQKQRANVKDFIARFYQEVAHVANSPRPDPELIRFATAISTGTNNEETIKFRHSVLVRRFIREYGPVELDEDRFFTHDQKLSIFRRDRGVCHICGRKLEFGDPRTHYHHVDPYVAGGETETENGLLVCKDCHLKKIHGGSKV